MLDLTFGQRSGKGRPHRRRTRVGEPLGTYPITFRPEALEAQGMIAVGAHAAAILEPGLPVAASPAEVMCLLALVTGGHRHGGSSLTQRWNAPRTAQVLRQIFAFGLSLLR